MIKKRKTKLFWISFIVLFLELSLIRYLPSEVYYLGFYSNFILIASFVGMGGGFLLAHNKRNYYWMFPWFLLLLLGVISLFTVSITPGQEGTISFTSTRSGIKISDVFAVPTIFLLVAVTFIFISQILGKLFNSFPPLTAYVWDISGSLAGILVFVICAFLGLGPLIWFGVVLAVFLIISYGKSRLWRLSIVASLIILVVVKISVKGSVWSPYQKINTKQSFIDGKEEGLILYVNNIAQQKMNYNLEEAQKYYFFPYKNFSDNKYRHVLIIGSGLGNDVSMSLKYGAENIDAVEIDPVIARVGINNNPLQPFADPRVKLFITDGRSFLENSEDNYDLIIFALTDSIILTSGNNNIRLESLLFTNESLKLAKKHLNDNGLLVLYNYYRKEWLVTKLTGMMDGIFNKASYLYTGGEADNHLAVIMNGGRLRSLSQIPSREFKQIIYEGATDDWPFLYLEKRSVPINYIKMLIIIASISYILITALAGQNIIGFIKPNYFFMGAAFMLLEVRSLVQFSLLYGNTWMVNAGVFFAILTLVLLAVITTSKIKLRRLEYWYGALLFSLILQFFFPINQLTTNNNIIIKYSSVSLITLLPILFANVIFAVTFKKSVDNSGNFASNVLGSAFGGVFEYSALIIGYKALLPVIGIFYLLSFRGEER